MANSNTPFGFKPVKHMNGSPWNGKVNTYYVPVGNAAALFKGDAVKLGGSADSTGKYPSIAQAAATDPICGVIVGFGDNPYVGTHPDTPNRDYCPAETEMYAFVVDDPFVIFEVQEDSVANSITADMVGTATDIATVGTGSTTTGKSAMLLDSSDTGTGAGQCRIMRLANREDNALGDYAKWEVLIAEHQFLSAISTDA